MEAQEIIRTHVVGQQVEFTGNMTIDLGDMQCNIRKGSRGVIVVAHHDNEDLEHPNVDGLFIVEIPTRHKYRVWVRAWRICAL
jgi:hypothetical protein